MKPYELQSDETVIAKHEINVLSPAVKDRKGNPKACSSELTLTNLNIIISTVVHRRYFRWCLRDRRIETVYSLKGVKVYRDEPQVKRSECKIELYHLNGECSFELANDKDARSLADKIAYLVSGEFKLVRGAKKAWKIIKETGEAFELDMADVADFVAKMACEHFAKKTGIGATIVKAIVGGKDNEEK